VRKPRMRRGQSTARLPPQLSDLLFRFRPSLSSSFLCAKFLCSAIQISSDSKFVDIARQRARSLADRLPPPDLRFQATPMCLR
jgi:hypothetical protein